MAESFPSQLTTDDYQAFVAESRFKVTDEEGWQAVYAERLSGELLEFLAQHGNSLSTMMPSGYSLPVEGFEELRFHMGDEMGDLLWFTTDAADQLGVALSGACEAGLAVQDVMVERPLQSFEAIEQAAVSHASKIRVPNKAAMCYPDASDAIRYTYLVDNPSYVFMRTSHRLTRALDSGLHDMSPPTATELEPIQNVAETIGAFVLSMAYVAKDRLGVPFEAIARFNIAKLKHRERYGKENDIAFDAAFLLGTVR